MSNASGIVFVTQEAKSGTVDYSPAKQFGRLEFLTIMDFSPEENSMNNQVLIQEVRAKLRDYDPEQDFVVITGSPTVTAVVFMILRERQHKVNILRWSNRDYSYTPVVVDLSMGGHGV